MRARALAAGGAAAAAATTDPRRRCASAALAARVEGKGVATSASTARSARRRGGSSTKTHVDDGLIAEAHAHDAMALARAMTAAAATPEFDLARLPKARDLPDRADAQVARATVLAKLAARAWRELRERWVSLPL